MSPPQHKTIHSNGTEVVANVIETCDKEETIVEGLSFTHGYLDEPFEGFGENAGREMLKVQNNF